VPAPIATLVPAACFDLLTLMGLHKLGRRLGGRPLAQAFIFAYLLYPFTDLSLMAETNDALIAALCVWTIIAAQRPVIRGLLIAAAALTKFVPALLAFQFLGIRHGRARYLLTLVAALGGMLAWPLITSGAWPSLDSTFGYQLIQRGSGAQFSIWTYLPHVATLARPPLAAALVLLAISRMACPGVQEARQDAALAATLLIGAQLHHRHRKEKTVRHPRIVIASISLAAAAAIGGGITAAAATTSHPSSRPAASQQAAATVHAVQATVGGKTETILVNGQGLPLYYYLPDTAAKSAVSGRLASLWPPLTSASPTATGLPGKLAAIMDVHDDQVAYNGHLLYTFVDDQAGQVTGQGVQGFFVVTPGLAPIAGSPASAGTVPAASSGGYGY
jgi:predicted lipoprotein with Yx(FWY)xxD motif